MAGGQPVLKHVSSDMGLLYINTSMWHEFGRLGYKEEKGEGGGGSRAEKHEEKGEVTYLCCFHVIKCFDKDRDKA